MADAPGAVLGARLLAPALVATLLLSAATLAHAFAPICVITAPADGSTVGSAGVTVSGTATDDGAVAHVVVRVNGSAWWYATGSDLWTTFAPLAAGANRIEARARDNAGLWGPIVAVTVHAAGQLGPAVLITAPSEGATVPDAATPVSGLAWDVLRVTRVNLRVNGGAWFSAEGTTTWSAVAAVRPGPNLIEARARNDAGTWGPISAVQLWGSADLRPVVCFTSPAPGATVSGDSAPVSGIAMDDLGVAKVVVRVNGAAWLTATGTTAWWASVGLRLGANLIEARARDSSGQWGPIACLTINGADPRPTTVILSPAAGAIVRDAAVQVAGTAADNAGVALVRLRVNGGAWFSAAGTTDWSAVVAVQPGANLVEARARDSLAQWGPIAAASFTGAADLRPVVLFMDPPEGATVTSANLLVSGIALDDRALSKVVVRVNGGFWSDALGTSSWSAPVTILTGTNLIEARARDGAGQWGPIAALHLYGSGFPDVPRFACRASATELVSPGTVTLIFEALVPAGTASVDYAAALAGALPASVTVPADAFVPVEGQEMVGARAQIVLTLPEGLTGAATLTGTASCESGGESFDEQWEFPVTIEGLEPVPAHEFRAAWTHSHRIDDPEDLFARLEASGLNAAIMRVRRGETAYYRSALGPISEVPFGNETLIEDCVAAAGRHGIDLHLYVNNLPIGSPDSAIAQQLRAEGRWQRNAAGEDVPWLCPSSPENVALVEAAMVELARDYDIAGVQYDFIRYVGPDVCFCERCRAGFEALVGRTVDWPAECLGEGPVREQWLDYRAGLITEVVRRSSAAIRAVNSGLVISAAVFSLPPEVARRRLGQDYETWCREGYLDALCPMAYTLDNADFEARVLTVISAVGGVLPVYPGIGLRAGSGDMLYREQFAAQVNIVRRLGAPGFAAFCVTPPTDAPETVLIPLRDTALAGDGKGGE